MDWLARVPLIPERAEATTTTPVPLRTLIDVEGVEGQRGRPAECPPMTYG